MDAIPDFLQVKNRSKPMRFVGSFTSLNVYRNCPEQMHRRYIKKDLGVFVKTPEMEWGDKVHEAFEKRIGAKKPLPVEMQQWEGFAVPFDAHEVLCEQKLGITSEGKPCDYWGDNVWFRGKADAVIVKGTSAYMADWKTGKSTYEDPFELATGALLLKAHYPQLIKVTGSYVWLKENRLGQPYDLSDFRETWREICQLMGEIEADKASGKWEKRKSGLCGWCNVTDCENHYVARR
jgi:hypothetical protein